jgi:hypothetical protein
MAKYKLIENGVFDTETGANIPDDAGNRHWVEYQEWLAEPNTPDPADVISGTWDTDGRGNRDAKLAACDWTQLADSPLDAPKKAEWATYRQELRDLPATYPTYGDVVWPTEPAA